MGLRNFREFGVAFLCCTLAILPAGCKNKKKPMPGEESKPKARATSAKGGGGSSGGAAGDSKLRDAEAMNAAGEAIANVSAAGESGAAESIAAPVQVAATPMVDVAIASHAAREG